MNANRQNPSIINAVQSQRIRPLIRNPKHTIVPTNNTPNRSVSNGIRPTNLIGPSRDSRHAIRARIRNKNLSPIRLHRQMNRGLAHIQQSKHMVRHQRRILLRSPRSRRSSQPDRHHLVPGRTSNKSLGGIRQNHRIPSPGTPRKRSTKTRSRLTLNCSTIRRYIEHRHAATAAIRHHQAAPIRRNTIQSRLFAQCPLQRSPAGDQDPEH